MKIAKLIEERGLTNREAAKQLGVHEALLWRWVRGLVIPRPHNMHKIQAWSGGQVMPADFYDDV